MFDKTKPNIILISDQTDIISMPRTLGVHKVAYCLREAGYEVAVIHFASVFSIREIQHMLSELVNENTLFVGINNFFYSLIADVIVRGPDGSSGVELTQAQPGSLLPHGTRFNQQIKNLIREKNPNCKLVLGGPTAVDVAHNAIFDYLVVGYAEQSIVQLADFLYKRPVELPPNYKSIYGPVIVNDSKAAGYDFSQCHMRYEDHDVILPGETLMLEIGRGCIFKCTFCAFPLNGKKKMDFIRSMDLIRQELIDNYTRFNVTNYVIVDDTFNDSVEKCRIFSEMVKTLPFKINWWAYIRLDLMTAHPETIDYLLDSGARAMFFGIETLNERTASIVGKGGKRDKLIKTIRDLKDKYKDYLTLHGSFVFGLPQEPLDSINQTVEFLLSDQNPLDSWTGYALNIRPNSELFPDEVLSELDKNYEKYGYEHAGYKPSPGTLYSPGAREPHGQMNWKNQHVSREQAEQIADMANKRKRQQNCKVSGQYAFYAAGLGTGIDTFLNKFESEIDWRSLDKIKLARAVQYKSRLFAQLGLSPNFTDISGIETYSDLLKSGKLLEQ